jgi:hypothetical protein
MPGLSPEQTKLGLSCFQAALFTGIVVPLFKNSEIEYNEAVNDARAERNPYVSPGRGNAIEEEANR